MSQETTTKLFFMGFFLHRLAHGETDFLASRFLQFTKSMKMSQTLLQQQKVTSHCVHHSCFRVYWSNAPTPATFTSFQHFYLGSPVDAATLVPGCVEDFQPSKVFIWVHQFHHSSRLVRRFPGFSTGFTSRCCHPATSPLWAMGSGD